MALDTEAGIFLPTTDIFDRALISEMDVNSAEFREFLVRLYQTTNNIALVTNIKDSGYYIETEFLNGQLWFENKTLSVTTPNTKTPDYRQVFRKVVNFGTLPDTTIKTIAHGLTVTSDYTFTRIYGTASDPVAELYLPIPYTHASIPANTIGLYVSGTHVVIETGSNRTSYTTCYVVLEYIKE